MSKRVRKIMALRLAASLLYGESEADAPRHTRPLANELGVMPSDWPLITDEMRGMADVLARRAARFEVPKRKQAKQAKDETPLVVPGAFRRGEE